MRCVYNHFKNQGKGGKHGFMNGADYQVKEFDFLEAEKNISLIRAKVGNMDS